MTHRRDYPLSHRPSSPIARTPNHSCGGTFPGPTKRHKLSRTSYTYDEFDVTEGSVMVPVYIPVY